MHLDKMMLYNKEYNDKWPDYECYSSFTCVAMATNSISVLNSSLAWNVMTSLPDFRQELEIAPAWRDEMNKHGQFIIFSGTQFWEHEFLQLTQ